MTFKVQNIRAEINLHNSLPQAMKDELHNTETNVPRL